MALIKCPECGDGVSDKAEKCPKCAYPISAKPNVQTIEQTSKTFKKKQIYTVLLLVLAFCFIIIGAVSSSVPVIVVGLILAVIAGIWGASVQFQIWWHHK